MRNTQCAFSLIEVMVVVVIIGLLASVVTVGVMGFLADSRKTAAKAQMEEFRKALDLYKLKHSTYPSTSAGLKVLTKAEKGMSEAYLKNDIPNDPWGNEYRYRCNSAGTKFEIISYGSDGQEGGEDEAEDIKVLSSAKSE